MRNVLNWNNFIISHNVPKWNCHLCQKRTFFIMKYAIIKQKKGVIKIFKENFHKNLKRARIASNKTQEQVAYELNTSRSNIAKYESGALEPNIETIGMLAEFYNVSTDWLFGIIKSN